MPYETTLKLLRVHNADVVNGNLNSVMMWHMKLIYEFWGFCINGSNSLLVPGGMPTSITNYLSMSAGFESGSSVLLASGTDGVTTEGSNLFSASSVNWTSGSLVGKHIVTWKSSSTCRDDSIYQILRVVSSSSVLVDVETGGTPFTGSLKPAFTARTNINFRVIDLLSASYMSASAGAFMVFQTNAAAVNPGQAASQVKFTLRAGNSSISACTLSLSPSGSWNGSSFSDGTIELYPDGATENGDAGFASYDWFNGSPGQGAISLWGDQASIMMHSRGAWNTAGSLFHIEVPRRLFPQAKDPNPICCLNVGKRGMTTTNISTVRPEHFSAGWVVGNEFDNLTLRRWFSLIKNYVGGAWPTQMFTNNKGTQLSSERFKQSFYNPIMKSWLFSDVLLCNNQTTASYSMGRVQLRQAVVAHALYPINTKIGRYGEWIHIGAGVFWPWDNAQLNQSILPFGS